MNKYIKTDLSDSIKLMRVAIMNAFNDIESGEEIKINLGPYISEVLLLECLQEARWDIEVDGSEYEIYYETKTPSGKKVLIDIENGDCILSSMKYIEVTISMCLSTTQEIEVPRNFNERNSEALKKVVEEQIFLPTDALEQTGCLKEWSIDDFAVV